MMNQAAAGAGTDARADVRLRTMRLLWAVFLLTVGLFFMVTRFARPDDEMRAELGGDNSTLLLVLAAVALSSVAASFVLKASFYRRVAEQRQPALLQPGFILALALCEVAVLMGLVGLFITWNDYAYALFALGALGEALHFPRRGQVEAAFQKSLT